MKDGVREWANAMMASAPEFDEMALRADSSLGLFVVARLAAKLGLVVTFDPSRYGGLRATVLIPSQHLVVDQRSDQAAETGSIPAEDTAVFAAVGAPAPQAKENATHPMDATNTFTGQVPMNRDVTLSEDPASALTPPDPLPPATEVAAPAPAPTDDRPRLPRREPQQNLDPRLQNDPDDGQEAVDTGELTARTLAAFHKGTHRGREGNDES
jgi:hypothetical protein